MEIAECWEVYSREHLPSVIDAGRARIAWSKLKPTFGHINVTALPPQLVTAYARKRGSSPTAAREIGVLASAISYCFKTGRIASKPYIPRPRAGDPRIRTLTAEERERLLFAARGVGEGMEAYVMLAMHTGARITAIDDLRWDQVDIERMQIDFRPPHNADGKNHRRKGRAVVPMNDTLGPYMLRRRAFQMTAPRSSNTDFVIPDSFTYYKWNRMVKAVGLPWVRPHHLRHTLATEIGRRHGLLPAAKMLGHKSVRTTESVYVHILADDLREAANVMVAQHEQGK